ncbi:MULTISPECIES: choice-of-anchor L domain-containing protein [Chryseobacterium]|uniref:Gliding motility-associated C-terminal domain n=1 Tax=Chryseobacterium taihuense TaxID=1141221 RepID=A0A4U8WG58_9FLAO|nr:MULTISPECIES: choice-of-anchor L domain-containing protein [Chryseobacterium]QQV01581.1 gliding motility-associated C-terminal domain-containing protein [Chryseobacterium sp. FDAARGOS 1104]VFB05223.1 gliding motility-associated C-terminal domain [Chryseobacterium taihuense]
MLNYRLNNYFKLSFFLVFLLGFNSYSQKRTVNDKKANPSAAKAGDLIDVNVASYPQSAYTPTQLVTNVLVGAGSTCGAPNISNVTVSPNHPVTMNDRFWGYFNKTTSNFPFQEGIVLTTGFARKAGNNPEPNVLSDGNGGGSDPDLIAAIGATTTINNAAILEFDFVPSSTQMKFNYIFASEEYTGSFPCPPTQYDDAFALLLKPNTPGSTYTNLAVLPGGAGPVSVTNILPGSFGCGPINGNYFGSLSPNATNYNGITASLTAEATVIPGQSYHIKMVVADARDAIYGSAVFLQAGSFDIGLSIVDGAGNPLPETINVCDNAPQVLTALTSAVPGTTYQWLRNDVPIPGATNASYTATLPGVYKVQVTLPGSTCPVEAKITIIGGTSPAAQNATLKLCATPAVSSFNLNDAKPLISTATGAVFRFYTNQADAQLQNNNFIPEAALSLYSANDGQVLHVVVSDGGFCSRLVTLTLRKEDTPVAQLVSTKLSICAGESATLTASGGVTYQWEGFSGTGAVRTVSPTQTTTYTVYAIGAQGCKSLQPAIVTVEVVPAIKSNLTGGYICAGDRITLDAGAGPGYSYTWSNGATGQTLVADSPGVYFVDITNGVCTKRFTTEVKLATIPEIVNVDYNQNGTLIVTASNLSGGALEYSADNGLTWQNSNLFNNIPSNTVVYIRIRVKNTSCVGYLEYFTFMMQNVITPNGDNVNDKIDFRGISNYNKFQVVISDRYGREVYKSDKTRPFWDGYFQGKKLPTASYWYQITFEDPASKQLTVKTGWILLKNIE